MVVNHEGDIVRQPRHKGTITQRLPQDTITQRLPGKDRIVRKSKSTGLGPVEDPVATGLARARSAWDKYRANADDDRDAVYVYLEAVFDLVQQWKKMGVADEYSLKALKRQEFRIRMKPDPYARLIYCTSEVDAKTRSKWAKIMQWVANHDKKGEPFTEFVKRHGGLNECAYSELLDRPPRKKHSRHR